MPKQKTMVKQHTRVRSRNKKRKAKKMSRLELVAIFLPLAIPLFAIYTTL